jgi:CBS domain containing-hemolysin-like protein
MLNTIVNILLQNVSSNLSEASVEGWVMKLGVPLVLILVLGEFLPKYLGLIYSERLAIRVAPTISFLFRLFAPLLRLTTSFAETMSRVIFFFLKPEPPLSASELTGVINACETKGVLSHDEASLIRHSLEFDAKEARELMTPRSAMPALKLSQLTKKNFITMIRDLSKHAILIIEETPDRPVGAVSNKEALLFETEGREAGLASAARQIFFVPEAMPARKLLQEFSERRAAIACVTDEHGSISGYIEAEDLGKTLLGYPQKRSTSLLGRLMEVGKAKGQSIIVPGTTPLTLINEHFKTNLTSEYHSATIGGWLEEMLDGIPQEGSSYVTKDLAFRVLSADEKMVKQLFIECKSEPSVKNQEDSR